MSRAPRLVLVPLALLLVAAVFLAPSTATARSEPTLVATHVVSGQTASQASSSVVSSLPAAFQRHPPQSINYDEQLGLTFTQDFTSIEYNVTAVEQVDPILNTGPGYLLSGLSNTGYWYQVGLSYNWEPGATPGTGFAMSYEVFNPLGNSIYPNNGGGGLSSFSGVVNQGDNVTLNLYFSSSGPVVMVAEDMKTGASAEVTFSAEGANQFVGQPNGDATSVGFFTGLMTEWYHGQPYYSNPAEVIYSTNFSISSGWMWMDEFNANNGLAVFAGNSSSVNTFSTSPTQLQEFSYLGITEYGDSLQFITGAASNSTTTATSTATATTTATTTRTVTSATTETVTTTVPVTVTQTASATTTSTTTATVTLPVTTTVTSTPPVTVTVTTTSTPPASTTTTTLTTTQTQTQTQTQTATAATALPFWSFGVMAILLFAGVGGGYLMGRPTVKTS